METLFTIFLYTHATAGGLALLTGSIIMIRKKGDALHAKIGLIYFYTALINAICAFFLAVYHPNLFLFSLGVLSFYLAYTGRRYLLKTKPNSDKTIQPIDWILNIGLLTFGLILVAYCIKKYMTNEFNMIPLIFGLFSVYLSLPVIIKLKNRIIATNPVFLKAHIGSMVGSYITIFSAFLVVNNHAYFPMLLGWFGPSFVFVPFIILWSKKYNKVTR